uniref:hypothetical protein n=1 Tax=Gelidibacter sp. TaxID=2018083 RepID=UPI004049C6EF
MKKIKLLVLVLTLQLFANFVMANGIMTTKDNEFKIVEFKYSIDVDYNKSAEIYFDENTKATSYTFAMKGSEDRLITYLDEKNRMLIPIAFVVSDGSNITYKDVNNRKEVLVIDVTNTGKIKKMQYFEMNDSKEGLALNRADCIGGSTLGCAVEAWKACNADWECRLLCIGARGYCEAAILLACAVSCNNNPSFSPE